MDADTTMSLMDFNSQTPIKKLSVRHVGRPDATTYLHNLEGDSDDYCDVNETIDQLHLWELRGRIVGGSWEWNGKSEPRDGRGHAINNVKAEQ